QLSPAEELVQVESNPPELLVQELAAELLALLPLLLLDEAPDALLRPTGLDEGQPVLARVSAGAGEHLHRVPVLQLVAEGNDLPVHLRPHASAPHLRAD